MQALKTSQPPSPRDFPIDTMPKYHQNANINLQNPTMMANTKDSSLQFQNTSFASSTKNAGSKKVNFWAGLRVEGGMHPFERGCDQLTRWNDKMYNGGLIEKIGTGLQK